MDAHEGFELYRTPFQRSQAAVVVRQSPKGGTEVKRGTKVELKYRGKP